jgi:hypothetical protein
MRLIGAISAAVLSLIIVAPAYGQQEQHDQQDRKDKPPTQSEKRAPEEQKRAQPEKRQPQQQEQRAQPDTTQRDKPAHPQQQHANDARPRQQNGQDSQQQNRHVAQSDQGQQRGNERPQRTQEQQRVQQSAWQEHRSQHWDSDHRSWQQRGGYNGYRIPDEHFRGYFGQDHGFRIYGLPFLVVGGYPRFQYSGYWFSMVDPWPESWASDWYDTDDVYVAYVDNGYYLFNRRYPSVGIAISISM